MNFLISCNTRRCRLIDTASHMTPCLICFITPCNLWHNSARQEAVATYEGRDWPRPPNYTTDYSQLRLLMARNKGMMYEVCVCGVKGSGQTIKIWKSWRFRTILYPQRSTNVKFNCFSVIKSTITLQTPALAPVEATHSNTVGLMGLNFVRGIFFAVR